MEKMLTVDSYRFPKTIIILKHQPWYQTFTIKTQTHLQLKFKHS